MLEEPIYSRDTGEPINKAALIADQEADTECDHHPDRLLANCGGISSNTFTSLLPPGC